MSLFGGLRSIATNVLQIAEGGEYEVIIFNIAQMIDILNVDNDNGLMFGFNQKAKTGFVIKDDEPDAFILRRKDKHSLRFTSKDLQGFFIDTFELLESGKSTFYFNVSSQPNERGLYAIFLPRKYIKVNYCIIFVNQNSKN